MSPPLAKKVLLIGWDAADWKVISPLMDAGEMPNMERFVADGVMGNIATLYPELSPMLWTSIATGKRPFKHGIYGFTEPSPDGTGIRPITNLSRRTKAVWNILSQESLWCNVIGWWPSHPAEAINGVMVSNHYQKAVASIDKPWPVRPGTVHPPKLAKALAGQRVHPAELTASDIGPFLTKGAELDLEKDKRVESIAKVLAETATIHSAATAVMQLEPWDFMAVYYDGIDHFSHMCMNFHPPRLPWVNEREFGLYQDVVNSAYRFHDMMLGAILSLVDDDTTVIIVSDHGFHSDHLRPRSIPLEPAGPAAQHRHYGIFAMRGPGVKKDDRVYGVSLLDICPTILNILGKPVGEDMDGTVVVNAFVEPPLIETVASWDDVPGDAGMHPADVQIDPGEAREAINQLVALGYIDKPDDDADKAVRQTVRELNYNLARAYMDANRHVEAVPCLEELLDDWPDEYRFGIQLVSCYQAIGRIREARELVETLLDRKQENALKARDELKTWIAENKDTKPEDFTEPQRRQLRRLRGEAAINPYSMNYLLGSLLLAEGNENDALGFLLKAEAAKPNSAGLYNKLGDVFLKMDRREEADRSFTRALKIDPESAAGHTGLARLRLRQRRNVEAADAALRAVALVYFNPQGHFLLGVALHRLNRVPRAVEALKIAIAQNCNFAKAYRRLAYIYKRRLKEPETAADYARQATEAAARVRQLRKGRGLPTKQDAQYDATAGDPRPAPAPEPRPDEADPAEIVTVVSGLPRSGTSMMMQMLAAANTPLLVDDKRPEDEDNPHGYLEYQPVRGTMRDSSWVNEAPGKAVKVIAQLLPYLPPRHPYKVIFMLRDLEEILSSQQTMLQRSGKDGANIDREKLGAIFRRQLTRVERTMAARANVQVLHVRYSDAIADPLACAQKVSDFLGGSLPPAAMAAAVDPKLHRQKHTST